MIANERTAGSRLYGLPQESITPTPLEKLRAVAAVVFDRARNAGRTIVEAIDDNLSTIPQPLAGFTPPVSPDEAMTTFLGNGKVDKKFQVYVDPESVPSVAHLKRAPGPRIVVHKGEPVITLVYDNTPEAQSLERR